MGEEMHCWREDCHSECGRFECVLWHWDVEIAEWHEDDCGINEIMEEFNHQAYAEHQFDSYADYDSYGDFDSYEGEMT